MSKINTWKLWLPIISLLIFFSIVELAFRFLIIHKDTNKTIAGIVESDPDLIWRLKPRLSGTLATNELGFRDTTYKQNADHKILLLGDSVSWGDGVDMQQSYPFLLEEMLNENYPEKTWNWDCISVHPNITWEIIQNNPDKPWCWIAIFINTMKQGKERWMNKLRLQIIKTLQIQRHWRNCSCNPEYKKYFMNTCNPYNFPR